MEVDVKNIMEIFKVNWLKTVYFNFKYLPFGQAVKLPCFVYRHVWLKKMGGSIDIQGKASTGMFKLGPVGLGTIDCRRERLIWEVGGKVIVRGRTNFGLGSRITIGRDSTLDLGADFCISGNSTIISQKGITFGEKCLLSWDILVMDTDFHDIVGFDGNVLNDPKPISFGNHVWVGCRSTILKGVSIADDTVVAAGSIISKSFDDKNVIVGGSGKDQNVIKRNINWVK